MKAAADAPIRTTAVGLDRVLASGGPALLVFETPGCEPCDSLRPILRGLVREFEGRALIVEVADAAEGWLAARYNLAFVPTLLFWRDGEERVRITGNPGPKAIREHLDYLLSQGDLPAPIQGSCHTLVARYRRETVTVGPPRGLLFP
jgi:thiol-disulfide isomerase/thioredoxin